jgi:hypothetical protein
MVEIEFRSMRSFSAVLTGEFVPVEDVDSAVTNVALGNPIKAGQHDDSWNTDLSARRSDRSTPRGHPLSPPMLEVKGLVFLVDHSGDVSVNQDECTPH